MKKTLIFLLALVIAGGAVFAQSPPYPPAGPGGVGVHPAVPPPVAPMVNAPSFTTTSGLWGGQWNNIMSPALHRSVEFENWIGFMSFGMEHLNRERFAIAYATRIGDIYLAAYYGGTGFHFTPDRRRDTEVRTRPWDSTTRRMNVYTPNPIFTAMPANRKNHRAAILVGVADMGFRFTYGSTMSSFNARNGIVRLFGQFNMDFIGLGANLTEAWVNEFSTAWGQRLFELEWAMSRDLLDIGVRPTATVRLIFSRDFAEGRLYNSFMSETGSGPGPSGGTGDRLGNAIAFSNNFIQPEFRVNSGWVNIFTTESGWTFRGDLDYTLAFRSFNNDFSVIRGHDAAGNPLFATRNISGIANGFNGLNLYEMSWRQHIINPRVQFLWTGETVALSTRLLLNNTFTRQQRNERSITPGTTSAGRNPGDVESSVFSYSLRPILEFGMRWNAIPNRLDVLAGGSFEIGTITRTTTETVEITAPGMRNATVTRTDLTFGHAPGANQSASSLHFGATFRFNENIALDATAGGDFLQNRINVFGDDYGTLTRFGSIMAVLSF